MMTAPEDFKDWQVAPNIVGDSETYELENEALRRDGRLDQALKEIAPWDNQILVDRDPSTRRRPERS